jgi:hypothetical protein
MLTLSLLNHYLVNCNVWGMFLFCFISIASRYALFLSFFKDLNILLFCSVFFFSLIYPTESPNIMKIYIHKFDIVKYETI